MDRGYVCCKWCKENKGIHTAMLCVNKERTMYRCADCGRGIDISKRIELGTSRKR